MPFPSLALTCLTCALAWAIFSKGGVYPADLSITLLSIASIALIYFFATLRRARAPRLHPAIATFVILFLCYLAFQLIPLPLPVLHFLSPTRESLAKAVATLIPISNAPLAVNPPAAVLNLFAFLGCIVTSFLIRDIAWQFRTRHISFSLWIPALPLFLIALVEATIGIVQITNPEPNSFAVGTYSNRNHFSGLLELILPLTVFAGLALLRTPLRPAQSPLLRFLAIAALWILSIYLVLAIFYSLSRAGFIVALTSLFLCGILSMPARPSRKLRLTWLGSLALLAIVFFLFIPPTELIARFADMSLPGTISTEARPYIWRETLSLIAEFPWFGTGPGAFESTFLKHQAVALAYSIQFAHNDYLQYFAELGLLGFAFLTATLAAIVTPVFRSLRSPNESQRLLAIGSFGSLTAIALHSIVDFNLYVPANALTLAWILGLVLSNSEGQQNYLQSEKN